MTERRLDPEIAAVLATLAVELPRTAGLDGIPCLRALMASLTVAPEPLAGISSTKYVVPGAEHVHLLVNRPEEQTGPLPCVLAIHGGGLISGSYLGPQPTLQHWSHDHRCVTATVEYRLAPEHPYPAAIDDCYHGLRWLHDHAGELGIDQTRIGVAGGSAGGGLAAALALFARDQGEVPLSFQLLQCPMLDDRGVTRSSGWDSPTWDPVTNATGWRAYLGALDPEAVPAYAAPARATDLAGLPPAFISVGGADIFLDEDVEYAQRLLHAGVPAELHVYPDAPHGFENLAPDAAVSRQAAADVGRWLARALGSS